MKIRTLFLATTALAALASCSNDELSDVNQGSAIRMRAFLNNPISRAAEMTPTNMKSFKVHAHSATNPGFDFTDVFKNNTGGGGEWNSDNKHYWPGDDSELQFFAYAPAATVAAADGKTIPNYTITATSSTDQTDLVVGFNKGRKSVNETSGLAMNFRHALSKIVIQATNSNTTNMKVEVIGVKIGFVKSKGTLTMPTEVTANGGALLPSGNWTGQADELNYIAGKTDKGTATGSGIELNGTAQNLQFNEGGFMLLPQKQPAWDPKNNQKGAYLAVLCRISQNDGAGNWNLLYPKPNTTNYAYSAVPFTANWEPGKMYTYTLDFFGNGGNGGGGQVDPDEPNGDGGNNIVGGPIKFTVTVDDWNDAGNTEINM